MQYFPKELLWSHVNIMMKVWRRSRLHALSLFLTSTHSAVYLHRASTCSMKCWNSHFHGENALHGWHRVGSKILFVSNPMFIDGCPCTASSPCKQESQLASVHIGTGSCAAHLSVLAVSILSGWLNICWVYIIAILSQLSHYPFPSHLPNELYEPSKKTNINIQKKWLSQCRM